MPLYDDENGAVNVIVENVSVFAGPKGDKGDKGDPGAKGVDGSGIRWTGDWTAGTYSQYDAVFHNGSSYVANTGTSQEPPGSDWDMLAQESTPNVTSVFGRTGVVTADAGDYTAAKITNTPAGNISATTVQAALNELDTEKVSTATYTASDVLTKIKTVDGSGSGLDADLLDGLSSASFQRSGRLMLSVLDYGATGDGVTDDGTAIASAITAARALTPYAELYWPSGTYLTTANISNLHTVKHKGSGRIKRGSTYWYLEPRGTQTNIICCSPSGSSSNDGITSSQPTTISQANTIILNNADGGLPGHWEYSLAAGTYTQGIYFDSLIWNDYPIYVRGPDVGGHPNTPTAIIDLTGVPGVAGVEVSGYVYAIINDVRVQDATTDTAFKTGGGGVMGLYNCHAFNCLRGILNQHGSYCFARGGIYDCNDITGSYGYAAFFNATHSIEGYTGPTDAPKFTRCTYGMFINEGCQGHVDYCWLQSNIVGLWMARSCGANNTAQMRIWNNYIGVLADNQWLNNNIDFGDTGDNTENATNVRTAGSSPEFDYRNVDYHSRTMREQVSFPTQSTHTGTTSKSTELNLSGIIRNWMIYDPSNVGGLAHLTSTDPGNSGTMEIEGYVTTDITHGPLSITLDINNGGADDFTTTINMPQNSTDGWWKFVIVFTTYNQQRVFGQVLCSPSQGTDCVDTGSAVVDLRNTSGSVKISYTLSHNNDSATTLWARCSTTLGG